MSTPWYEKVPKSDRETKLAGMSEGRFLSLLRKASAGNVDDKKSVTQSALAETLDCKPGLLRDIETGCRPVTYRIAKVYCDAMGVPVEILKKVGKKSLRWPDAPAAPTPAPAPEDESSRPSILGPEAIQRRDQRLEEDRQLKKKLRAEDRVTKGSDQVVDLDKVVSITFRNQNEECLIATLQVTSKGNLIIDLHPDDSNSTEAELLKAGFTGVRIAAPQVMHYDMGREKKVFEVSVPVKREANDK